MYLKQSNTRPLSSFPILAGEDLTGMDARLGILTNNSGVLEVELPGAVTDECNVIILEGAALGSYASVAALDYSGPSRRFLLEGTCSPGEPLVMADPATAADSGMVRDVPADAGTYLQVGIALETGIDGQWVEVMPFQVGKAIVVV